MTPDECPPVQKELLPFAQHIEHVLRSRRSIHASKKKPLDWETISKLIDISRYAPSGHNTQPVRWHVIYVTILLILALIRPANMASTKIAPRNMAPCSWLAEVGYDPNHGTCSLMSSIQRCMDDPLALKVLGGTLLF